jgi:hypothetical protein
LEFVCYKPTMASFDVRSLPLRLTNLVLDSTPLTSNALQELKPQTLPHLRVLRLRKVTIEGSMRQYLQFPELNILEVSSVRFSSKEGNDSDKRNDPMTADMLSDITFFRSIAKLQHLSLEDMPMRESLPAILQDCSSLQYLAIHHCQIVAFIPTFVKSLVDVKAFLALKTLHID